MRIFISHASEDKDTLVTPLVAELKSQGISVWYDKDNIRVGNSILNEVFDGIETCSLAVVIVSKNFIEKKWTIAELEVLQTKAIEQNFKIIPIIVDVEFSEIKSLSNYLATKLALVHENVELTACKLTIEILREIPDRVKLSGKDVSIRWYCPRCSEVLWGEVDECPNCKSNLTINEKTSLFSIALKNFGWIGAIIFCFGLFSIYAITESFWGDIVAVPLMFGLIFFVGHRAMRKQF